MKAEFNLIENKKKIRIKPKYFCAFISDLEKNLNVHQVKCNDKLKSIKFDIKKQSLPPNNYIAV